MLPSEEVEPDSAPDDVASKLPEDVVAEFRNKHGNFIEIDAGPLGVFAFGRITQAVNDRLLDKSVKEEGKAAACREAVLSCLLHPVDSAGKPQYDSARALFQAAPDLPIELVAALKALAPKFDIKKL